MNDTILKLLEQSEPFEIGRDEDGKFWCRVGRGYYENASYFVWAIESALIRKDQKPDERPFLLPDELEKAKKEHPDICWCEEDGYKVTRKWSGDGIVGQWHYQSPFSMTEEATANYYKCSRCGKKYYEIMRFI